MIDARIQKERLIHRQPVLLFKDSRAMLSEASGGPVLTLPLEVFSCAGHESAGTRILGYQNQLQMSQAFSVSAHSSLGGFAFQGF
jgi:hypothetical protein